MRRALPCVAALAVCVASSAVEAQVRSFPYEAVVETDGVPVHSGSGFYVTNRLKRGDRVVVQRHDPGGWYVIAPPDGEFSLIPADAARVTGPGAAEIVADEVYTRVGSRVSAEFNVEQVPLSRGDRIQLAPGVTAPAGWIAIRPPRGEFRWVPGKYLVPARPEVRSEQDADPFAVPSVAKRPETFAEPVAEARPAAPRAAQDGPRLTLGAPEPESRPATPADTAVADTGETLRRLDRELEGLTLSEPTDWPLEELAAEYRRLKAANPASGRQIDVRLAQIERMRMVREHYTDYVRLTSATDERDAALLARRAGVTGGVVQAAVPDGGRPQVTLAPPMRLAEAPAEAASPLPPAAPPAEPKPIVQGGPPFATGRPSGMAAARPRASPSPAAGPVLLPPTAEPQPPADAATRQAAKPPGGPRRFDAVGVVQKAVDPHPEAPRHVLVAPNGRILVYLQEQPGVSLDAFVGKPMGVDGERHRHPDLATPMIVVERLTPVRF
ncbi:MAG TPA: hypothetical protein VF170_02765 [Planctomycetaceae bacterium]